MYAFKGNGYQLKASRWHQFHQLPATILRAPDWKKDYPMSSQRFVAACFLITVMGLCGTTQAGIIKGRVSGTKAKSLQDAVVYLDSVSGEFKPPDKHLLIDQRNLVFSPHVLPLLAGTTVDFLNSDNVPHNVFSPDASADKFNLGTWPTGKIKSYTFVKRCDKTCDATLLCKVHPEMEAFVVIMQNPYFAKADTAGQFTIADVPAGHYTVQVWHPKMKAAAQSVNVPKDGSIDVAFALGKK